MMDRQQKDAMHHDVLVLVRKHTDTHGGTIEDAANVMMEILLSLYATVAVRRDIPIPKARKRMMQEIMRQFATFYRRMETIHERYNATGETLSPADILKEVLAKGRTVQ